MIKILSMICILFISGKAICQKIRHVKIENVDGYLIESFKYDSFQHVYNKDGIFLNQKGLNYLILFFFQDKKWF